MDFTQLKFGNFTVGQRIKAFDFEPMKGRCDKFVIGTIVSTQEFPYAGYIVKVEEDSVFSNPSRPEVIVPMEVAFLEYDNRVTLVL